MEKIDVIKNIAKRTGGDIYLGVVGAVRTGKSTFIRRFMENMVIPNIQDEFEKKRALDELPQAANGKMIMTTEPKFVPASAAKISIDEFTANIKMIDCVGYVIKDAKGVEDENGPRYVMTPWYSEPIPFVEAAEIGTEKVIKDHSTIGIVVTTDGSFGEFSRNDYLEAEETVITELQEMGKPYIVLLNTVNPGSDVTIKLASDLHDKYNVPVLPINVEQMQERDMYNILKEALYEFPVSQISIQLPTWVDILDKSHWLKKSIDDSFQQGIMIIEKLREVETLTYMLNENEYIETSHIASIDSGNGNVNVEIQVLKGLYTQILKEILNMEIVDKASLLELLQDLSKAKKEYDSISNALKMVKQTGYGFASATLNDIKLSDPEIVKQQNRYGVKIKAIAPSIHMIKVDVESIFEPIIGSKQQSEELIRYLTRDLNDSNVIWESDIFGRKLSDIIKDGLNVKLSMIPETARIRLQEILTKLVNKGKGNVIAIVL